MIRSGQTAYSSRGQGVNMVFLRATQVPVYYLNEWDDLACKQGGSQVISGDVEAYQQRRCGRQVFPRTSRLVWSRQHICACPPPQNTAAGQQLLPLITLLMAGFHFALTSSRVAPLYPKNPSHHDPSCRALRVLERTPLSSPPLPLSFLHFFFQGFPPVFTQ